MDTPYRRDERGTMYVVTGRSALRLMRTIRCGRTLAPLPHPQQQPRVAALTASREAECEPPVSTQPPPTLEETHFDFDAVEANHFVDLSRFGEAGHFGGGEPLELGVFSTSKRHFNKSVFTRLLSRSLPSSSLTKVAHNLMISSPELLVLQLSRELGHIDLARVIMELCGSYAIAPRELEHVAPQTDAVEPVLSLDGLRSFMRHAHHIRGNRQTLQKALQVACEGAASPTETMLALILALPIADGGYELDRPCLNAELVTPSGKRPYVAGARYVLDAFYQQGLVDLEVESTRYHLDPLAAAHLMVAREYRQFDADEPTSREADPELSAVRAWQRRLVSKADDDRRRMRDVQALGIQVIPVTSFDMRDATRMDQVAWALAERLNAVADKDLGPHLQRATTRGARLARQALLDHLWSEGPF